jgi:hypothetical protein
MSRNASIIRLLLDGARDASVEALRRVGVPLSDDDDENPVGSGYVAQPQ